MKLGLGLYRHMLTPENFQFAKQAGATHIIAHLVDYFHDSPRLPETDGSRCWGLSDNRGKLWTVEELLEIKKAINAAGLEWYAIENFDPSHWYDVLLDGPKKKQQLEDLKTTIRRIGQAGIPVMGYCFTIAGVWGHVVGPWARGGAESVGFDLNKWKQTPIPAGQVWNMMYDPDAGPGVVGPVSSAEMWQRVSEFLKTIVPVAEEAGVRMASHPDDPPMPELRGAARLVYQRPLYQKLLDIIPSRSNSLEFCVGTLGEMADDSDLYQMVDHYARQKAISYVHLRNVRGKVPNYHEVFIDEGDVDIVRVLKILRNNAFDGVIIPDHTPQMNCGASWHAGMAFALGYIRGVLQTFDSE